MNIKSLITGAGNTRLLVWAAIVGVLAGGTAVAFRYLATQLPRLIWTADPNLVRAVALSPWWLRISVPTLGSLLAGLVLVAGRRWTGAVRGWDILEAIVLRDGILHMRPALVKSFSSMLTVASAGAIGREGPMVLLSSSVASLLGRRLGIPTRQLRILVGCGAAAGIACAYNTPVGAALFTMEIIVGNFTLDVFAPLVFSSVVATLISHSMFGSGPIFPVSELSLVSSWEIVPYIVLGVLAGLTAGLFLQALRTSAYLFRKSGLPRPITMALAGLTLGIVTLGYPQVVGNGREAIRYLFQEDWGPGFALTLLGLRLLVTSAMVGSGAIGGVFTPTLFIGAALGDAFGSLVHRMAPALTAPAKAYALVGMGSLLAGTTHAPLTAAVMIFEMTLDYPIVMPLLLASAAASLVAREVSRESLYTEALKWKRSYAAEQGEAAVMRALTVRDVMRAEQTTVPGEMRLPALLDRFLAERRNHFYVVDREGRFEGVIAIHDVNRAVRELGDPASVCARDLANSNFQSTVPWEHLDRVLERFWSEEAERLPVLEDRESRKLIGTVSQRDILGVYSLEVLQRRSLLARFDYGGETERAPTYVELPADHAVESVPVPANLIGVSLAESTFRVRYGVAVLLILRVEQDGKQTRIIPVGSTRFGAADRLIVFGSRDKIKALGQSAADSQKTEPAVNP